MQECLADTPEEEWISDWGIGDEMGTRDNPVVKNPILLAGADMSKDQSYFLSGVKGCAFYNTIFPLGDLVKSKPKELTMRDQSFSSTKKILNKSEKKFEVKHDIENSVRDIAFMAGLPNASKKESMGVCFIGKRKSPNFIAEYLGHESSGKCVDIDTGEV